MNTRRRFRVFTSLTTLALALTVAAGLASADRRDRGGRAGAAPDAAGCDHDQARGDRDPAERRDLAMGRDRDAQRAGDFWRDRAGRDARADRDQGMRGDRDDRDQGMRGDRRDDRADARPGKPARLGKHHGRAQGRRAPGRGR